MSISLDDVHNAVVDAVAVTVVIVGTGGEKAQLTTVNVVPHVELPCGEQFDAAIVLGKSSKSTTAWRKGLSAQAVAAARTSGSVANVPLGTAAFPALRHAENVTTRVLASRGF